MIRFVLHFPGDPPPEAIEEAMSRWRAAANRREAIDVAVAHGITVQDMGVHYRGIPALVRRARSRAR